MFMAVSSASGAAAYLIGAAQQAEDRTLTLERSYWEGAQVEREGVLPIDIEMSPAVIPATRINHRD